MGKKGALVPESVAVLILAGITLIIMSLMFYFQFSSGEAFLEAKAQTCRATLQLSKLTSIEKPIIKPLCTADRIKITKKLVAKYTEKDETQKEGALRLIFERMNSCQDIISGPTKNTFFQRNNCYICSTLEPDNSLSLSLTQQDLETFARETVSPRGHIYIQELYKDGQIPFILLEEGKLNLGKEYYAITYLDRTSAQQFGAIGSLTGGCVLGARIGFFGGPKAAAIGCAVGGATGGVRELILGVYGETVTDLLLLTELKHAGKDCDQVVG